MTYSIRFDGRDIQASPGQTVAAALWAAGVRSWRTTRDRSAPRGLFCGIGVCFDCLVTIDGVANRRSCLVPARAGMAVNTQHGVGIEHRSGDAPPPAPPRDVVHYDIAVVGAGPAGLAAAVTAVRAGCRVALLDAGPRLGGQFWRHRDGDGSGHRAWETFTWLRTVLAGSTVDYRPGAAVWFIERGKDFALYTTDGQIRADRIVLATGAYDRALPFPGWDLPGVVTLGAAQALLKGSGVPIGRRVAVAGAGPFLLPVATALLTAGVTVVGVYESGDPRRYVRALGAVAGAAAKLREAAGYAAVLAKHRVPYRTRHVVVAAHGSSAVSSVDIARLDGRGRVVPDSARRRQCDALAVAYGFTPQLELPLALGCATRLDADGNLVLSTGVAGETSVPGVYAAGEVTGVGGAPLALVEGRLVGAVAAQAAGQPGILSEVELTRLLRRRSALRRFARVMHEVHSPPAGWPALLRPDTTVCRCEEVPAARIRAAVADLGATDARTVKLFCRAGMGWCQGRVCGFATAALTAHEAGRELSERDIAAFAHRPLAQPVRLGHLAAEP